AKLREEENRYAKAYGAGLFSIERLQELATPLKERITLLEGEIAKSQMVIDSPKDFPLPEANEIDAFAEKATVALQNLKFEAKRAIVVSIVDRIVGTQKKLQIYGHLPIKSHVEVCSSNRHGVNAARHAEMAKIPFEFCFELPAPRNERIIVSRDQKGRIL